MSVHRNIAANYLGRGYSIAAVYLFIPLYVRILGIEAYGLIAFYSVLLTLTALTDVGLSATFSREAARKEQKNQLLDLLTTVERVLLLTTVICAFAIFCSSEFIATKWLNASHSISKASTITCLRLMALTLPSQMIICLYSAGLFGLQYQVRANGLQALYTTIKSGLVIAPIFWYPEPWVFFAWQLIVTVVFAIFMRISLVTAMGHSGFSMGMFSPLVMKPSLSFAGGMMAITIISSLNTQLDKLVVSKMLSVEEFSYYALAGTLAQLPVAVTAPIIAAIFPKLTELNAQGCSDKASLVYENYCFVVAIVSSVGAFVLIFFAQDVLSVWLARDTLPDKVLKVVKYLSVGGLLLSLASTPFYLGLANGYNRASILLGFVSLAISIPLLLFSVAHYGMLGAAIPWVFLNATALIVLSIVIHLRYYNGKLARWWIKFTAFPVFVGAIALFVARIVADSIHLEPLSACFTAVGFGLIALMLLALLRLDRLNLS